ncbi:MAG: S9 family peptidase, partial [Owenweeksia sp.]
MKKLVLTHALLFLTISLFSQAKKVTLEDVWLRYSFYARGTSGLMSMKDGLHYTALTNNDEGPTIEKFSYKTGESVGFIISTKVIKEQTGKNIEFDQYEFSPNEDKVLLATETESIYRHSTKSYYYVYDLKRARLDSISVKGKQQLATFSPTRNQVAFVYNNQMYIQDFDSEGTQLISFGKGQDDAFIAGAVDWVYEEEFSFDKGFQWSPDGSYLAYYQFDEREVPLFSMDLFGSGLYPYEYEFKYPKAGEPNSKVNIHLFHIKDQRDITINLPEEYEYIPRIKWTRSNDQLVIYTMNRLQNKLTLWRVNAEDAEPYLLYQENAPSYIEITDDLRFLKDGSFIWTSERDGYNHIYHISNQGEIKTQLTKGTWPVTEFYGIDEDSEMLYYQSAEESPMERAVYSINLKGKEKKKLSQLKGWNSAEFSSGFKYYINSYSSKDVPTLETLHSSDGSQLRVIQDNAALKTKLRGYNLASKEFFKFTTEDKVELNGWIMKPFDFDPSKKYPVLMFVYG